LGRGYPCALQLKMAFSPWRTVSSRGVTVMIGGAACEHARIIVLLMMNKIKILEFQKELHYNYYL
jgi:hypothetical protein